VLLIEDDPGYARLIREILKEAGAAQFDLAHAERLDEGLKRLGEEAFDVMLLDLNLPDSQGLDTFLRAYAQVPEVPIVVLTGLADEVLGVKAIQGGAQDYLVKGQVDSNLLERSIRYAIERKQVEEVLRQRNRELTLLNRLGQELTTTFNLQQLTERLLQTVMETIGAEAVSVWLWDEERKSWLVCQAAFPPDQNRALVNLRLPPGQGIVGWVAREEKSAIVADVQSDPRFFPGIDEQTGFHTASLLAVPLRARGKLTGVLEVVNKRDGDFDEDNRALIEMLAASAAIAIENARLYVQAQQEIAERKQAEEALHYRLAFDQLITSISTLFVQLAPDDVDSGIDFALQVIAKFTAVDRSYIFLFSDDRTEMDNTHEWCAEGIPSQIESRRELPVQRFPWWMQRLNQLQTVHIPRVADLPPEAKAEKEFLESQAVQSLVAVPMVYNRSLVGFVGFDSVRVEKTLTEDIITLLKIVGEIFVNALVRKRAEKQIWTALQEKEVLLKEIHHRVKNNLQIISSLLDLQSDYIEDEQTRQLFQESRNRVKSMALIHERLYRAQDLAKVDFAEYIQSLARDVFRSYRTHATGIALRVNVEDVFLGVDTAIPCGLMINELVSNALKYAFPDGRGGEICVELFSDNGQFTLAVRDNGVGFPKDLDFRNTESLGLKLVVTLVKQLKGTIALHRDGGTAFEIKFAAVERKRSLGKG
jgi:two-component sensor histidine kinase/DNA-binding response OmpR family regulator